MGYTHFDKVSGENGVAVGVKGSEVEIADSSGNLSHGGTPLKSASALNTFTFSANIDDVSTSGSTFSEPVAFSGTLTGIRTTLNAAIASGDASLSFKIGSGVVSGGGITIANSGSAIGDVDSALTLTANTSLVPGNAVECISDGGSTNTAPVAVTFIATHV